jgi:hypothetical protein
MLKYQHTRASTGEVETVYVCEQCHRHCWFPAGCVFVGARCPECQTDDEPRERHEAREVAEADAPKPTALTVYD